MPTDQNKKLLAKKLGVSRASLYYRFKMKIRDECLKEQILATLSEHPSYGHKRIALHLKRNKKCILRVMHKYGIKPYRRRVRRPKKPCDLGKNPLDVANYAKVLCPLQRNILWASDLTYFWFRGRWWYFATVIDVFSREVVGYSFSSNHDSTLILDALKSALKNHPPPHYLHSDQGSEYRSYAYIDTLKAHHILVSFSNKASPWQNGYQESFYSEFKNDLGDTLRFETVGEFLEGLHLQIFYYNNQRIHTALKMPPALYKQQTTQLDRLS